MRIVGLLIVVLTSTSQQVPTLDLTIPLERNIPVIGGLGSTSNLPVVVTLIEIPHQATVDDDFIYEIEIRNDAATPLTIPWSSDRLWQGDELPQLFKGSMSLSLTNGISPAQPVRSAASFYGSVPSSNSVLTLQPGGSARIRATGTRSVHDLDLDEYLKQSNGQVQVRATFELQRGWDIATAPLSPARTVSLLSK